MWYSQGSVTVTNGSGVVTGAGTDFVSNASVGEAFIGPDGRTYEIAQIVSATDLRLRTAYQAATGGGQAYAIQPTQSLARDLALAAAALLSTFAAVRDGVGQGLFGDGSAAAPAIRFSADQDTGIRRVGSNVIALVTGAGYSDGGHVCRHWDGQPTSQVARQQLQHRSHICTCRQQHQRDWHRHPW